MTYEMWLNEHPEEAKKVTSFKSFGGNIKNSDGSINVDKVMSMSIMMVSHNEATDTIEIYLC